MSKAILPILMSTALITPVAAEQMPVGFASDARIKHYIYDENNVYKLTLYLRSVTAIQFAEGESVEAILIGDSTSWEVTKLKRGNVVSVKATIDQARTNMTVYTDQRVYTFELRTVGEMSTGKKAWADQAFRTVFIYPDDKKLGKSLVHGGALNRDYLTSGHARFRPLSVTDDTLRTTFVLAKGAPRPAIFKIGRDGEEELINSRTVDAGVVVVDGISDYWVMRIGDEAVCVGKTSLVHTAKPVRERPNRAG
ncbi:conjugal transfer protein [Rhizobium leguminosarum]|nr:conjugal transfer protein [Rhizobium leguminosarum]